MFVFDQFFGADITLIEIRLTPPFEEHWDCDFIISPKNSKEFGDK